MEIQFTKVLKTVVATVCLLLLIVTSQTKFNHSRTTPPTPSFVFRSESRSKQPKNESPVLSSVFYILYSVHYNSIMSIQTQKFIYFIKITIILQITNQPFLSHHLLLASILIIEL